MIPVPFGSRSFGSPMVIKAETVPKVNIGNIERREENTIMTTLADF